MKQLSSAVIEGQAVYTPRSLLAYDVIVHGVSNPWIWRCPTQRLVDWYALHMGAEHCDVGVGTGYLLEHAAPRTPLRRLALLDLNPSCLEATALRLARFAPSCVKGNVLEPIEAPLAPFDSVGLGYLLHCVPGELGSDKAIAFDHLARLLKPDGTLFGATILGSPRPRSLRARTLMGLYNQRGIFHNRADSLEGLRKGLGSRFAQHAIELHGEVALFSARGYVGPGSLAT